MILEETVRDSIVAHLSKIRLITPEQHGFTVGASTDTQLADSVFDWRIFTGTISCIHVDLRSRLSIGN